MDLFPKWRGIIDFPPIPDRKLHVGGNLVLQRVFEGAKSKVEISRSEHKGHDHIQTKLNAPYDALLLRHKGARRIATSLPVLVSNEINDPDKLPDQFTLAWDSLNWLAEYAGDPDGVLQEWRNRFSFRSEDRDAGTPGLRAPQVGALHAISAHFAVGAEFDPATVVLPTGTGKTETMLAALVYRRLQRCLVIVPSDALRSQIANKFVTLGMLTEAGVIPAETPRPRVATITTGITSAEEANEILKVANVIVALPNVLSTSAPDAVAALVGGCTDLIVDEAHHVTASTWSSIKERFADKRVLQFTATPFRRDGKRVDGKIIFNYKLGDAQAEGYYRPIQLRTVEEYGDQEARDLVIAREAVRALMRDRNELKLDHLLMARTSTKERAEAVANVYRQLAPALKPVIVYSGPGRALANREALRSLMDRGPDGSRIVVCVDMLGEGFDLPYLKVAALHDTHKSLAVTLQFIGRFTRTGDPTKIGDATVVTNIADPEAEEKLAQLYAEGADWDRLIKRLSEERIAQEIRLQDVVEELRESGDLHENLSLWNLRPPLSTQLYRTECDDWRPEEYRSVLPKGAEHWHALSQTENVLVAVICRETDIGWGNYQSIYDTIYDLIVMRWDKAQQALFVFASDYNGLKSEKLARSVTSDDTTLIVGPLVFNILNNVELPLVKSLGSSRIGAISFTSYFGPNVTDGLASIEKAESALNNIACLGYEDGERVLWGGTQRKGKVWQQTSGTIAEWIDWTKATWSKVNASTGKDVDNIVRDFLRPERITGPYKSPPISVQWGEQAQMRFHDHQFVVFDGFEVPLFVADVQLDSVGDVDRIVFSVTTDTTSSRYELVIDEKLPGGYRHEHLSGPRVKFRYGSVEAQLLEEYLEKDPLVVRYADGTYSYNCYHIPLSLNPGAFDKTKLEAWDWGRIPLNQESMGKLAAVDTIQYRTFKEIAPEYDVIFNDDGSGEAADLVCLKDVDDETIRLALVHIKGAHGGAVSQDIRNFYVVCGQAQKSITVKHAGLPRLYQDLTRRNQKWTSDGATRFLKGDPKKLAYFKDKSRRAKLDFEMVLVQPGASIRTITDDALRLLATTELYVSKTTQAKFRVVISP